MFFHRVRIYLGDHLPPFCPSGWACILSYCTYGDYANTCYTSDVTQHVDTYPYGDYFRSNFNHLFVGPMAVQNKPWVVHLKEEAVGRGRSDWTEIVSVLTTSSLNPKIYWIPFARTR